MGRIVVNGKAQNVVSRKQGANRPSLRGLRVSSCFEGHKVDMELYSRKKVLATQADLALVQETLGLNMSEACQVSVHLVANAIRSGRISL
jgi:hypothetical protein